MADLFAWTDCACSGNPGPGGWGVLMRALDGGVVVKERELSGGEALTTNNRMELMAAIEGLNALTRPCRLTLSTDSIYVRDGITKWVHNWRRNGWRTSDKKPVSYTFTIRALAAGTSWTTAPVAATGVPTYDRNSCSTL